MESISPYKIIPSEFGWNVIDTRRGEFLFQDRIFPSPQVALEALQEYAMERGLDMEITIGKERNPDLAEPRPKVLRLDMTITPDFNAALDRMAERLKVSKAEVIRRAVNLFKLALDAKDQGKRLLIADDESEQEIAGL